MSREYRTTRNAGKPARDNNRLTLLTTIVCLLPVIAGAILYPQLPDMVATNWNSQGVANDYHSKFLAVIVFPGILVLVNLLMPFLMRSDPKYHNMGDKLKVIVQWIIPVISVFAGGITLGNAMGMGLRVELLTPLLMGFLFVLVGNYLPKTKQSYTLGIKLPWTLASEENWNATHRIGGFVWMVCGFIMIIAAFFPWRMYAFFGALAVALAIPTVYSYRFYKREQKAGED